MAKILNNTPVRFNSSIWETLYRVKNHDIECGTCEMENIKNGYMRKCAEDMIVVATAWEIFRWKNKNTK